MIRITKWKEVFENADTRKRQRLKFFAAPSGVDSSGYISLMAEWQEDGILALGVFQALCQQSATFESDIRGDFRKSSGAAMSVAHIATLIRCPLATLEKCLAILSNPAVGWIEIVTDVDTTTDLTAIDTKECQEHADNMPLACQSSPSFVQGQGQGERQGQVEGKREGEGASPARSHDQKKEIEEGESPQGHDPVTLESAKALAESCSVHDPVIVESWHANRSADGWKRPKGAPITAANWRDDLRAFGIAWKQRESTQAHHSPPGGAPSGEARERWQIQKDITHLKLMRQKLQNDHRNYDLHPTEPGQKVMKPEPKKKSADIREKLAELEAELINA